MHGMQLILAQTELDQHAKLHADLDGLTAAIQAWKAGTETYDAARLRTLLNELAPNFRQHLHEEVEHLAHDTLAPHLTSQELKDCIGKLEEEAKKGDPFVDPVFMMSHTPAEHKVRERDVCAPVTAV